MPCSLTWEKEWVLKEPVNIMSFIIWRERVETPLEGAFITTSESPLKIDWCSPSSTTNWQALLATKVSNRSTVARRAIFIDKAASISPLLLHTATSIPASLVSTNTATIKVCFQFINTRMSPFHCGFALLSWWYSRPLMKL